MDVRRCGGRQWRRRTEKTERRLQQSDRTSYVHETGISEVSKSHFKGKEIEEDNSALCLHTWMHTCAHMHSPLHTQTKICVILNLILKTGITINYAILNAVNVKLNLVTDVSQRAFPTPMELPCDPSLSNDILEKSFCLGWVFDNLT